MRTGTGIINFQVISQPLQLLLSTPVVENIHNVDENLVSMGLSDFVGTSEPTIWIGAKSSSEHDVLGHIR